MRTFATALAFVLTSTFVACSEGAAASRAVLEWGELPSLPDPVGFAGPFAGVSSGALIVAGGANFPGGRPWDGHPKIWHDGIFVLTEPSGKWWRTGKLPRPLGYGVSVNHKDRLICIGGGDKERHYADAFELAWTDGGIKVTVLPSLPKPVAFFCGAVVGDTVYVAGGIEQPDSPTTMKTFWALDLSKPTGERQWQELEPWPGRPRMLAVAAAQAKSFFLFSGTDLVPGDDGKSRREYLTDAYRYAPNEGWKRIADLPQPTVAAPTPAISLGQSHILVFGGDNGENASRVAELKDQHPGFPAEVLAYHTVTDTWIKGGELLKNVGADPANNPNAGVWPPVTTVATWWNDRIVIPSGEVRPGVRTPRVLAARPKQYEANFGAVNYAVLAAYLVVLVWMGFYFAKRERSTDDFFLAGRRIPWWAAGLSIYGTQLSAITFMAIPATIYATNWVPFLATVCIVAVAPVVVFLYLPFFRRLNVTTAYEYLEKRFNVAVRLFGSLSFILYQLGRMGIVLLLPAIALSAATGINMYVCIALMGVLCTIYTVLGGIEAVIWTDVLQVFVLLGGAIISLCIIVGSIDGGVAGIVEIAKADAKLDVVIWSWDYSIMAVWVVVVGNLFANLVPYTTDQAVIQRYLTTKDEKAAARAIWTNAALVIPGSLVFYAVGTALYAFFKSNAGLLEPTLKNDAIFPLFIAQQLPVGVAGLVIAGVFAASMSSLDSSLNSVATALVTDFYRRFKPDAEDHGCLVLARTLTVILGVLATVASLVMASMDVRSLWFLFTKILGLLGGGLAGIFALGVFTRRTTGVGALVGAVTGSALTVFVWRCTSTHFFLYAAIGIATCFVVGYLVSLVLPARPKDLSELTLFTLAAEETAEQE